ncbi:AsnC family transcriptional regulator [Litorihabitans aurantiacus]|uniref:AsnC family transcriptional regulator n=2 Tax=Litorihabitans aurantiacus TaxID=1930061 RepID=A0AA37XFY5_9MICO|nr:AsnC family transcriptional regulator [Litorihabitans aurantiacus]
MAALAQQVGISRSNAYARVESMTAAGIVTGFQARVDPAAAGLGLSALVFVTVNPQSWSELLAALESMPEVESAMVTTGEHDVMLHVRARTVDMIHAFVVGEVAALPQVKSVVTVLVLQEVFHRGYVLPTDIPPRVAPAVERGLMRFTSTNPDRPGAI